jgi:exosortase/archaeosortase family protein
MSARGVGNAVAVPRNVLFAGLIAIGFANGSINRAIQLAVQDAGSALGRMLGISIVAWTALVVAIVLVGRSPARPATRADLVTAGALFLLFLFPAAPASWLGLTLLGAYLALGDAPGSSSRRGGIVLLALTVPMFWSRILMSTMSDLILTVDAILVSAILTADRVGNTIAFADGWGYFWIAPECSSLANISLALLCWVVFTQTGTPPRHVKFRYCIAAVLAVIAINVGRMALTGISRAHYELVHGALGNVVFDVFTLAAMVGILFAGMKSAQRTTVRGRRDVSAA